MAFRLQAARFHGDPEPLVGLVARAFVLGGLPHSAPGDNEFHREFGNFRLSLMAPRDVGLPYGRIPRLILSQLTTQAVRERTPELVLARSFRSLCASLGMPATGGPNGYLSQVRKQLVKLVDLSVKASWAPGAHSQAAAEDERIYAGYGYRLCTAHVIPGVSADHKRGPVWIKLSEEAFRLLSHKPVPVNLDTLKQLQSPMAMDIYVFCTWRAMRAMRLGRPEAVSWTDLQRQLGSDYSRIRDFRSRFSAHLLTVLKHYPTIRVTLTPDSLVIHSYKPDIPSRPPARRS